MIDIVVLNMGVMELRSGDCTCGLRCVNLISNLFVGNYPSLQMPSIGVVVNCMKVLCLNWRILAPHYLALDRLVRSVLLNSAHILSCCCGNIEFTYFRWTDNQDDGTISYSTYCSQRS